MNELFKYKEIFEREIENLDFYEVLWKKTILWLYGAFVSLCVFAKCVNYVRYVSYVFASWLPSPGKKHIPVLFSELDDDDCNFDRKLSKGSDILNFICSWVVLFVCKSMLTRPLFRTCMNQGLFLFCRLFWSLIVHLLMSKGEWRGVRAINFMAINISS